MTAMRRMIKSLRSTLSDCWILQISLTRPLQTRHLPHLRKPIKLPRGKKNALVALSIKNRNKKIANEKAKKSTEIPKLVYENQLQISDLPNSALLEMQDKFLKNLNRQGRA